jgi:hypothetical protein
MYILTPQNKVIMLMSFLTAKQVAPMVVMHKQLTLLGLLANITSTTMVANLTGTPKKKLKHSWLFL